MTMMVWQPQAIPAIMGNRRYIRIFIYDYIKIDEEFMI